MTLNGSTALQYANNASFGVHHGKLKKKIDISSKMSHRESTFGQYKAHANICGGSVGRGLKGWSEPAIFRYCGHHISGIFRIEANTIMQHHEVPH